MDPLGKGERGDKGLVGDKGASGEDTFMAESLWLGWTRWTWMRLAYVGVFLMGAFGLYQNEQQDKARADAAEVAAELRQEEQIQFAVDGDYEACLRGNDTRKVIRDIIELDDGVTDLTVIDGFDDLDYDTRQFLVNLRDTTAKNAESGESFKQMAIALLPIRGCEEEFPTATDVINEAG